LETGGFGDDDGGVGKGLRFRCGAPGDEALADLRGVAEEAGAVEDIAEQVGGLVGEEDGGDAGAVDGGPCDFESGAPEQCGARARGDAVALDCDEVAQSPI
jgi:hypothetical protein